MRRRLPVEASKSQVELGIALQMRGKLTEAIANYERALQFDPGSVAALNNRGLAMHALGRLDEAAASLAEAVARHPEQAEPYTGLGNVLQAQGRLEEAAACHERALAIRPDYAEAWSNLGSVRHSQGRLEEAAEWCARAAQLKPDFAEAYNNLGDALASQGRLTDARRCFEKAIELKPNYAQAHFNRAAVLLLCGDFVPGWQEYEWRLRLVSPRDFGRPRWDGEPLSGSRILLHAEQGLGDTLQFLRYVPLVRAAGGEVVLEVQPQLRRLALELHGVAEVVAAGEPLPTFDWYCPLMSLPLVFGTTLENIPEPALYRMVATAAAEKAANFPWQEEGLRVGLVWAGSVSHVRDRFRSIAPEMLEPLLGVERAHFFPLQLGKPQLRAVRVTDLTAQLGDMADTAALLSHLDLVIAADTSVAHLAGAFGKPVWILLPFAPDWRWLLERQDSPWYPSMRLFRQTKPGDWAGVIEAVRLALVEKTGGKDGSAEMTAKAMEPVAAQSSESSASPCKICGVASSWFGSVDFHKSCLEAQGKQLPLSGIPVHYRRCGRCGFLFTEAFDGWARGDFEQRIYNADYGIVDPDFATVRPLANAALVTQTFERSRESMRILDYGGGSGLLAATLRERGFSASTYDPFSSFNVLPDKGFDLITCFEVMEHVPHPKETVAEMVSLLQGDGAILFSTLTQPAEIESVGLNWWYAAPRNGHVSLYTPASLAHLFKPHGVRVGSFTSGLHIAYGRAPAFAAHLNLPG